MNILIRPAQLTDAEAITMLSGHLGYPSSIEQVASRLTAALNDAQHQVWVAVGHDQVMGWVQAQYMVRVESDPFVEIVGLVVHQDHRNKGIGRMLVACMRAWANSISCNRIRVRCRVDRTEAHQFYIRLGFSESKMQKVFDASVFE